MWKKGGTASDLVMDLTAARPFPKVHMVSPQNCCGAFPRASRFLPLLEAWVLEGRISGAGVGPKLAEFQPPGVRRVPGGKNRHVPATKKRASDRHAGAGKTMSCLKTCCFGPERLDLNPQRPPGGRRAVEKHSFRANMARVWQHRKCRTVSGILPTRTNAAKARQRNDIPQEGPATRAWAKAARPLERQKRLGEANREGGRGNKTKDEPGDNELGDNTRGEHTRAHSHASTRAARRRRGQ